MSSALCNAFSLRVARLCGVCGLHDCAVLAASGADSLGDADSAMLLEYLFAGASPATLR